MKIALLTIWHEKNYGAELQAYATMKVLQQLGHEVHMIDIRLSDMGKPSIGGYLSLLIESISPCQRKFKKFWKKYIQTTRRYKTIDDLQKDPPIADIYLVGSDQVWNPEITKKFVKIFFLDFGSKDIKRISYASSFGVDKWNFSEVEKDIYKLLNAFSYITCRERSGVNILNKEFGIDAKMVVDPTLLLGDYTDLLGNIKMRNTLVCYPLGDDFELQEYAKCLASRMGLTYVDNFNKKAIFKKIIWNRNSIEEWVNNIASSKLVLTRSFHGMLFSIMFNKDFIVVSGKRNSRLVDFLSEIGLMDRFFTSIKDVERSNIFQKSIDYTSVNKRIEKMREYSIKILNEITNG